ncbi:nucleolar complex protein 2 [Stemphylium lycopersici]|uniref:Nucleolar complex protein 2 n=1 Tax=Stemphylium lycopersici TaxID=183478 RepID=A0A364N532_STELY|nr:ribosome assembly protein noc2 [Stemphylium lycopersici]RAR02168.1 nucleolar complex protein 2 [Stemphylium lycopersici]RAR12204.1 nucleolar complex protein 2 [Stemphylium lycopersici]
MPVSKATKKFQKDKLGDTIKRRKDVAKIKQRKQMDTKRKERKQRDNARADDIEEEAAKKPKANGANDDKLGEMSMDQFFQGGFEIPEMSKKKTKPKTGKRKRTPVDDDADADADAGEGSDEEMAEAAGSADESGSESESGDDVDQHKEQLAGLAEKDPDFYKYLKENDAELLDFAEDADLAEIDALSASEDEATPRKKQKAAEAEDTGNELTIKTVQKWKASMESKHSLRAMKEVVLAFRSAAHMNDEDGGKSYKYSITDPDVYHQIQVTTLQLVPKVLQHHLPVKESAGGRIRVPTDSKKFRTLTPLLKSHTVSMHHLLENLADAKTLKMTLDSLSSLLPYILSFKKIVREVTRSVAAVWADSANNDGTRVSAFLVLRRLLVIADPSIREAVLKQTYQGLVKGARNTTIHNVQGINLMKNTAAELWGIDPTVGYTTGFGFIRQLAIHLRTSITNKTKDSYKTVYNWQYIHSLDFWSRVVSMHCESLREAEAGKPSPLRPLIYPVVQVTLGAMRLIPTSQYFPLRFQLVRSLLRVAQATSTYIPLAPALVEVLNSAEMKKPPKPSTLKALDFNVSIRATKAFLRTRVYQDGIGEQVAELLSEFFVLWTKNIAFPELALPVIVMLKRWVKAMTKKSSGNKNGKVSSLIALLVQKLEANSRWVEEKRNKVEFAPNNRAGVDGFLKDVEWDKSPLGAFVAGQRKSREQKMKMLEDARKTEDRKRVEAEKAEKKNGEVFGDNTEEEEEEDDEEEEEDGIDLDGLSDEDLEMADDDEESDEE